MKNVDVIWALGPPGLLMAVCLLWWFVSWARQRHAAAAELSGFMAVLIACCRILLVFILTLIFAASFFSGVVPGVVVGVVFVAVLVRYRRSEVRYLIWNLAEAAQRGIPLETVARAFANEQHGTLAGRARNLADYLDAAMPLSLALARSQLSPSPEVRLAADVGEKTGTLSQGLKKALQQMDEFERVLSATFARFFYLGVILFAMMMILTFLMIKIMPVFTQIFQEFGLQLPTATRVLIQVSTGVARYGFICLPVMALLIVGGIMGLLSYLGYSFRSWPLVGRFFSTIDNASLMRTLSVTVKEKRPLVASLELLAAYAPFSPARSRLHRAIKQIAYGAHWCDALQRARLVSRAQATVFKSAEQAGNLAWALDEMADSSIRRASLRAQAALNVAFPGLVLLCGMGVMFVAVGVLLPLFDLISKLT